jgi:sec-independent protein translocase protein TatA
LIKTRAIIFREVDMFGGGIGMSELLVVLVIVLIIFGAGKLPEIGKGLGKGIRNFRRASSGLDDIEGTMKENEKELEDKAKKTQP